MDKIYYNGKVRAIDKENRVYEAIGIQDGRIAFLGSNEEARELPAAEKTDLNGKTVLPGFIDSHLHMLNYAFVKSSYRMAGADSIEGIIAEGRRRLAGGGFGGGKWLYGRGWDQNLFREENRFLEMADLDRISTEVPILFIRNCGHIAAVHTPALEQVLASPGIEAYLSQIDQERGLLTEASVKSCYNVMKKPTVAEIREMILNVQEDFVRCGITMIGSDNFLSLPGRDGDAIMQAFSELEAGGQLILRVQEQPSFTALADLERFLAAGHRTGDGGDYYRIGPVKLFQDGSLGARTALMNEPYEGTEETGTMIHDQEELQALVDSAYRAGCQILVHTIGDKASDMVAAAYAQAIETYGKRDARLAINHLQLVSPGLFDKMKEYDMLAYIQPVFVASDKGIVEGLVGKERADRSYAWKTMLKKGLTLCGGSDAPVESFDILANIETALTRDRIGECTEGWHPEEKLTMEEAMRAFTIDNAYGMFEEDRVGSLEIGKLADLVILERDLFTEDPHRLHEIGVAATVVGGREVYCKEDERHE
ncbi:MAG: amidohydrolase [Firmicutes bacterium]|nr:amidohydrolase [Bacillota bacterium]